MKNIYEITQLYAMLTLMFNREKETCYYRHARANLIMITQDIYINFIFPLE